MNFPSRVGVWHSSDDTVRMTAVVHGKVQGVGFRMWTRHRAEPLGLVGQVANRADGTVEILAEGRRQDCERLLTALRSTDPPGRVEAVAEEFSAPAGGLGGFVER